MTYLTFRTAIFLEGQKNEKLIRITDHLAEISTRDLQNTRQEKMAVTQGVALCSLVYINRRFGEAE
jgi:hypothetical protein